MFSDIIEFHEKFGLTSPEVPKLLSTPLREFRVKFMQEELDEFERAHIAGNMVDAADALADLTYVVLGTAYMMGLPFNDIWDAVHRANMRKRRAESAAESKRGSRFDVVKPEGWVGPEVAIEQLLLQYGWQRQQSLL